MKITFETEYISTIPHYRVEKITNAGGEVTALPTAGQYFTTQEAAVISAMITIDADSKERENQNFINHATRMTLRMIGSKAAY